MSVNESNPVDAFGVEAPPRRGFGARSVAARALLLVFGFLAALVAVALLVMATLSQMQWQRAPEDIHDKYLPARTAPVPPANRAPTPADVGDIDDDVTGASSQQQQFRPGLAPGFASGQVEQPSYTPQFAPSYTPASPPPKAPVGARPAPHTEITGPAPAPPRASTSADAPAKAGGYRRVAGKVFRQRADGALVDTAYTSDAGLTVVEVRAGSPEYAKLLEDHKELAQFFRLSDRLVLVAGGVLYRVTP